MKSVGQRIRQRRRELDWTQERLAEECGANRVTIANYENGKYLPSLTAIQSLARALKTTPADLTGEDEPFVKPADADLLRIPEIAMMAREMGEMTESQRAQMLAIGRALMKEYFNVETENK